MSIYLDGRTSAYLESRNISPSAVEASVQSAMETLSLSLLTGEPIDADTVHFVMDYHNDSAAEIAKLKSFLNDVQPAPVSTSRVNYYLSTLKRPLTDALAPLLSNALFASSPTAMYTNLYNGLNNAKTLRTQPPAQALSVLAQAGTFNPGSGNTTGTAAVKLFAEDYINTSIAKNDPIDLGVLNAYIASDPAGASTFIGTKLKAGNLDQQQLMDAYRQLNPNDAAPSYAMADLNLDEDFLTLVNAAEQPLSGWASMAVKQLLSRPDKPVDEELLAQLRDIAPQAAAWVSYQLLKTQIATPSPSLSSAALSALGAYHQALMITLSKEQLNGQLTRGNYLDDNAYNALAAVDYASAKDLYSKYVEAGLVPPKPDPSTLSPDDFAKMAVGELMTKVQFARANLMESEIKGYVAKIHAQNQAIANFQKLRTELQELDKLIPSGSAPGTVMSTLNLNEGAIGSRMNTILGAMTGFKLFPSTGNGQYSNTAVTVEQVKNAAKAIEDQLTSLSTTQQQDITNMNIANNNRNESMEWLSNILKKLTDARASVLRNM